MPPPWRDVRGERRLPAQFVDGPFAGTERIIDAAPDGAPPPVLSLDSDDAAAIDASVVYELVSWGQGVSGTGCVADLRRTPPATDNQSMARAG